MYFYIFIYISGNVFLNSNVEFSENILNLIKGFQKYFPQKMAVVDAKETLFLFHHF